LKKRVSEILSDVESISHELHSSKLELLGLNAAVRSLCREFAEDHKMAIDFVQTDIPGQLPKDVATCLFRVAQEALSNCVRHSKANRLQVRLSSEPDQVYLSICDDGIGFDPETAMNRGGLGLISMRERLPEVARFLGGDFGSCLAIATVRLPGANFASGIAMRISWRSFAN
jgi:signal transduction histidine kinase